MFRHFSSFKLLSFIFCLSLSFSFSSLASPCFAQASSSKPSNTQAQAQVQVPKTPLGSLLDDQPSAFKAKQTYKQTSGYVNTITYFQKGSFQRIDTEQNGVEMSVISRPDKEKKFLLVPSHNGYSEILGNSALFLRTDPFYLNQARSLSPRNVKIEDLGSESLSGHPCNKFRISFDEANNTKSVTIWKAKDLQGLIIRQDLDFLNFKDSFELSDVDLNIADSIFDLPNNLKFFASTQEIFQKKPQKDTFSEPIPLPK